MTFFRFLFVIYIILFVLLFYGIFYSPGGLKKYLTYKKNLIELKDRMNELRQENNHLLGNIKKFRQNRHFREHIIRDKLGWIKEGERIIVLSPTTKNEKPGGTNEPR